MIHRNSKFPARKTRHWIGLLCIALCVPLSVQAQDTAPLQPFVLAATAPAGPSSEVPELRRKLAGEAFEVLAEHVPLGTHRVLILTHADLLRAAAETPRAGYAAVVRVAISRQGDEIEISFTNPVYLAAAFGLTDDLMAMHDALVRALGFERYFGSEDGLSRAQLDGYNRVFGGPEFDDPLDFTAHPNQTLAVLDVERRLNKNNLGFYLIYRIDVPDSEATLFGFGFRPGADEFEGFRQPVLTDLLGHARPARAATLPLELLVHSGQVETLNPKFRWPLFRPDMPLFGDDGYTRLSALSSDLDDALAVLFGED